MTKEPLFVYGTLLKPSVQEMVFGRTTPGHPDKLAGYKKHQIQLGQNVYPIIKPAAGGTVEGAVLTVTPMELKLIDRYEGSVYQRQKVKLVSGQHAWVYRG